MAKLNELTIIQAHEGLKKKDFSSVELTEAILAQIDANDADIHAYLEIAGDLAREQAEKADQMISKNKKIGYLCGVPIAIKDNILIDGLKCTAASKILDNYIAPYDATVIKKLREVGTVFIGKTNMDEFAMGTSTENSAFGPTKNPLDLERVPGGSSGGSAAAIAADEAICALGSDTGGSIRQPASFCGVVGLKPTYGRVSRHGLISMASSLDQIGPITKTTEDAAILLALIEGKDVLDSTSAGHYLPFTDHLESFLKKTKESQEESQPLAGVRIGIPNEYFAEGTDPEVEKAVREEISRLEKMGAIIDGLSLPHTEYALACYFILMASEVSSNLARYDGIRYGGSGIRNKESGTRSLLDIYLKTRGECLGAEVKRRIMLGTYALSAGYYDAYYLQAQKVRNLMKRDFDKAFEKFDVLITPTAPSTAFKLGEKISDPVKLYLSDLYTAPASLAGVPAISLPCRTNSGLPIGLQIIGKHFSEEIILRTAMAYESAR